MAGDVVGRSVVWHLVGFVFRIAWLAFKVAVRFAFGLPLDGKHSTNATFWSEGTESLRGPSYLGLSRPSRWAYMPGHRRMMIRWAAVAAVVALAWWPTQASVVGVVAAGVALGVGVFRAVDGLRRYRHNRRYVWPLHDTLGPRLGVVDTARPDEWLEIPPNFRDQHAVVTVELPPTYARGDLDRAIEQTVSDKLSWAKSDYEARWHMEGSEPFVEFHHRPTAPDVVRFADVVDLVEAAPDSAPVIGLGRRRQTVSVDLDAEAPHTLLSMAPGAGKSMFAKVQAAQLLHNGHQVVILDYKRHSHKWARNVPGVLYLRDIEDIHNGLVWLGAEGNQRNRDADDLDDDEEMPFTRIYVTAEEMNALIRQLDKYWKKIRPKKDMPSPAIDAWFELLFMGRAVKIHVLAIAQSATARTLGGPEARETFSNRVLGRYTQNNWRMLVPEVWPMPKMTKHRGRVQVVVAGEAEETQVIKMTDAEARDWAMSGTPSHSLKLALTLPPAGDEAVTVTEDGSARPELEPAAAGDDVPSEPAGPVLMTLREAADNGVVESSLESLRAARYRDPEFPEPHEKRGRDFVYSEDELQQWERNRPRAATREFEDMSE